jgi:hypothetical protein
MLTKPSLQLDIGIIAACAPTLRPLLGRALRLSTSLDPHKGANYYRAGKALDRLPASNNSAKGYLRQNTASGQFAELVKGEKQWVEANRGDSVSSATVVHAEHVQCEERAMSGGQCSSSDDDAILQVPVDDPDFKGIIKTTEIKVET